jgi:hypothetical protein
MTTPKKEQVRLPPAEKATSAPFYQTLFSVARLLCLYQTLRKTCQSVVLQRLRFGWPIENRFT